MIQGIEKLKGCSTKVIDLSSRLDDIARAKGTQLIISSGKRDGDGKSWHNSGDAIDFYFKDSNVFKYVSEIFQLCLSQQGVFEGVTQFEVVRNKVSRDGQWYQWNHIHIAFGDEPELISFTAKYKKYL